MDFRRIQWIFLIIFIAIDIFLGTQWYQGVQPESTPTSGTAAVLKEMHSDDISFSKPSDEAGEGFYLAGKRVSDFTDKLHDLKNVNAHKVDNGLQVVVPASHAPKVDPKDPAPVLDAFIQDAANVIDGKDYVYSARLSSMNQHEIVYVQALSAGTVFSYTGQIRFQLSTNNSILSYTQTHIDGAQMLREKTPTISEEKALIWLYQYNEIPNDTKVAWSRLAYAQLLEIDNTTVYVPTWFFGLKNQNSSTMQVKKVNAFTGVVIKGQTEKLPAVGTSDNSNK
ncbi:hypothetical protein EQG49_06815 [Periweissella cryptocerci]|uniref:Regulatory protein YycH-like domain-containing protein n=1 Tax=Periweissella cryptocerci TaxID=2506420 RepID=A0A4P6YU10_9LACO|nr:two-component system regulatory protein YycI [Periweissella cryptocerci]QBO36191.1 hypothetical protein EQG49_06815 [Periweissella cryptocerci]